MIRASSDTPFRTSDARWPVDGIVARTIASGDAVSLAGRMVAGEDHPVLALKAKRSAR